MLLSIVIPYYNVESYVQACFEPLRELDPTQVEVLWVDDCGQDSTRERLLSAIQGHSHMRILTREQNGGLSAARNTGLDAAQGEYVYFLDSDDYCDASVLLKLAHQAKKEELDLIKARFLPFDDRGGSALPVRSAPSTPIVTGMELFASQCDLGMYEPMVWQCIYRRAFLFEHNLRMAEGMLFEDELFQTPALFHAKRVRMCDDLLLYYRQREGSIMSSFNKKAKWCSHYVEICRRLSQLAAQHANCTAAIALRKRTGQIALSIGKNIPAYRLEGQVKREAMQYLSQNRFTLARFALKSHDLSLSIQGILLALSPKVFLSLYFNMTSK